ncbi:MAG: family N-acetyltransferase [Chitinophagaceae bacterium]|nr:family N-acetyltransferase [Chitinophagaceae bacterium]
MVKANFKDKSLIVDILSKSFDSNKSVNFVAKQDAQRLERIRVLMEYSFEICFMFGEVYLSEDKQGCALLLYPEKKKTNLKSIYWDAKLAFNCIGITRIGKVLKREALIKSNHPKTPMCYLWFLGVNPDSQNKGIGSNLIKSVIQKSVEEMRDIYLETSTLTNIPWYQKFNFKVTKELDLGYKLFIFKRSFVN